MSITVRDAGQDLVGPVDTGADDNFISLSTIEKLGLKVKMQKKSTPSCLINACGRPEPIWGYIKLCLATPGWSGTVKLNVAGIEDPLILGMPWLHQARATLDFSQQSKGEIFFVHDSYNPYSDKHHQARFNLISEWQL